MRSIYTHCNVYGHMICLECTVVSGASKRYREPQDFCLNF